MSSRDNSLHNICIAAIRRHTRKPYDFKWTRFYEKSEDFVLLCPGMPVQLLPDEFAICSVVIDPDNFSVLTTQRLFTMEKGKMSTGKMDHASDLSYGLFKAHGKQDTTTGKIGFSNRTEQNYFVETGYASMVMIYGVRTRIQVKMRMTEQNEKFARIWNRKADASE